MGLFGLINPWDDVVEQATSEQKLTEDWADILEVCDQINAKSEEKKDACKAILKKAKSDNQRVSMHAVVLLDAAVKNCGVDFRSCVCSKESLDVIQLVLG